MTICKLKEKIQQVKGFAPDEQRLFFIGEQLEDGYKVPDYYASGEVDILRLLTVKFPGWMGPMRINALLRSGKSISLDVEGKDTTEDLHAKIQQQEGTPSAIHDWRVDGRELKHGWR